MFIGKGLGFRVWGLGFRVWGLGFRVLLVAHGAAELWCRGSSFKGFSDSGLGGQGFGRRWAVPCRWRVEGFGRD